MVRQWLESRRGMSLGLERVNSALERLGRPDKKMRVIHVAGSNGKGTACATIALALQLGGHRVGLFTSPHVSRIEERIRLDGKPISSQRFDNALNKIREIDEGLTFFEITYLTALIACEGVDWMVLETGLGGRLDATRSADADVCLITSLSLEHSDILGDSLEKIAIEKAGIYREGVPLYVEDTTEKSAIKSIASDAIFLPKDEIIDKLLSSLGVEFNLFEARQRLNWPARLQFIESPAMLLDSAHNPSGMEYAISKIEPILPEDWILLFGTSPQYNMDAFLRPLKELCIRKPPKDIVLTKPQGGRYPGVFPEDDLFVLRYEEPAEALAHAVSLESELILSIGSIYLQGNLLSILGLDGDEHLSLMAQS